MYVLSKRVESCIMKIWLSRCLGLLNVAIYAVMNRNLYDEIVNHRSIFNKIDRIDYNLHAPDSLNFISPLSLIEQLN